MWIAFSSFFFFRPSVFAEAEVSGYLWNHSCFGDDLWVLYISRLLWLLLLVNSRYVG